MIQWEVLYTCPVIKDILGFEPSAFEPLLEFEITHPDDIERHAIARSRMIRLCNDLFAKGEDYGIMTTNFRSRHVDGHYINFLYQAYAFLAELPKKSVYCLFIKTDIDWYGPIKNGYNYYVGKDLAYLRVPDEELIRTGTTFTSRELEIIKLIRDGKESKEIAEILFISPHTVDTHRRNILKKTGNSNTSELIIELQSYGFI
jgi:DNA-binding CsgD family transcriptional regulator